MPTADPAPPVVFCHGLFGWGSTELGGYPYFVCASELQKRPSYPPLPRFLFPATGPISSLHDQACELFYQLKGGVVDYGQAHSEQFGHARYARDYSGAPLYPEWDEAHPLDFVAHSMGAPVVRMLQYLLASGFFTGQDGTPLQTSSPWVRSLTTVAGVHNGSTLTWLLGADEGTGRIKKNAHLVNFLVDLIERYAALQKNHAKLSEWYDFQLDQWGIDPGLGTKESLARLFSSPSFADSTDWALYDLTPNAMEQWNQILVEYPGTLYYSYTTRTTFSFFGLFDLPVPLFTHWFFLPFALAQGMFKFRSDHWTGQKNSDWQPNDGMCPTWSQEYPRLGRVAENLPWSPSVFNPHYLKTGLWYVMRRLNCTDHGEVAMIPHLFRLGNDEKMYRKLINLLLTTRGTP